ncbi:MAG: hypothetical protein JW789_04490 [Candidatus Aenigmarchaeota archaeon]|nr:hypothetical protein [Candidatus Aenigmarchaeota archaeon]
MEEENQNTESEILKSINDKLAELEDLQLVNKLDIINVKNELDRASLSDGNSAVTSDQMSEIRKLVEKADSIKKAEKLVSELEELRDDINRRPAKVAKVPGANVDLSGINSEIDSLRERLDEFEKLPVGKKVKVTAPGSSEIRALRERIEKLETAGPVNASSASAPSGKAVPTPKSILSKLEKIERFSAQMEKLKDEIGEQKSILSGIKSRAGGDGTEMDDDVLDRLKLLEAAIGGGEDAKPVEVNAKPSKDLLKRLERMEGRIEKLNDSIDGLPHDSPDELLERFEKIEKRVDAFREPAQKPQKAIPEDIIRKIKELEGNVEKLSAVKVKSGKKSEKKENGDVEELRSMIESIRTSIDDQGKDILDLKTDKGGAGLLEKIDTLSRDINSVREQISGIEKKAASVGMAPDALEELRKFKGEIPIEEIHAMKSKIEKLEKSTSKLNILAEGLKPIDIPDSGKGSVSEALEKRVKSLEKEIGEGVGYDKFKDLERRMEELREWLPEYVGNDTKHRLDDFSLQLKGKLKELDDLKEEIVENTIEQLLAQPGTISKLLGDQIKGKIDLLDRNVAKMEDVMKPSEAKMTTILRQFESFQKQLNSLKDSIKKLEDNVNKENETLGIDMKALNTRLSSFDSTVRNVEDSGVVNVMRDIEILKTKADWLESTVHKFDLKEIHDKIEELEERFRSHRGYSPVVIE